MVCPIVLASTRALRLPGTWREHRRRRQRAVAPHGAVGSRGLSQTPWLLSFFPVCCSWLTEIYFSCGGPRGKYPGGAEIIRNGQRRVAQLSAVLERELREVTGLFYAGIFFTQARPL